MNNTNTTIIIMYASRRVLVHPVLIVRPRRLDVQVRRGVPVLPSLPEKGLQL